MVRGRGFEPPWVTPLAPKASASTISPPAQRSNCTLNSYIPNTVLYTGLSRILTKAAIICIVFYEVKTRYYYVKNKTNAYTNDIILG